MEASTVQQQEQLFRKFENYDFEADANFQVNTWFSTELLDKQGIST